MTKPKIRLLMVDDSKYMLLVIRKIVERQGEVQIVGEAANGAQALEMAAELKPDVITMDVQMPGMDGVMATRAVMRECPTPVIMVSSHTEEGAQATVDALAAGAVDFISKMSLSHSELLEKLLYWGRKPLNWMTTGRRDSTGVALKRALRTCADPSRMDLVMIGVSTGGPPALRRFLTSAGPLSAPLVVAQHMPDYHTGPFAQRLREDTGLDIREGAVGMKLTPGSITILPGGVDGEVRGLKGQFFLHICRRQDAYVHPNADILFETAAAVVESPVGIIMTGMGNDGARGSRALAQKGAPVLVQEPETCVIEGMPQSALDAGTVTHVLSPEALGEQIRLWDKK